MAICPQERKNHRHYYRVRAHLREIQTPSETVELCVNMQFLVQFLPLMEWHKEIMRNLVVMNIRMSPGISQVLEKARHGDREVERGHRGQEVERGHGGQKVEKGHGGQKVESGHGGQKVERGHMDQRVIRTDHEAEKGHRGRRAEREHKMCRNQAAERNISPILIRRKIDIAKIGTARNQKTRKRNLRKSMKNKRASLTNKVLDPPTTVGTNICNIMW